jgi:hypothetical protein
MGAPFIYDISSLRVNDLTFILLTWRKWLAPNNASTQQMGFNSGFKGLTDRTDGWTVVVALKFLLSPSLMFPFVTRIHDALLSVTATLNHRVLL